VLGNVGISADTSSRGTCSCPGKLWSALPLSENGLPPRRNSKRAKSLRCCKSPPTSPITSLLAPSNITTNDLDTVTRLRLKSVLDLFLYPLNSAEEMETSTYRRGFPRYLNAQCYRHVRVWNYRWSVHRYSGAHHGCPPSNE
jgi:hypothetical protein